MLGPKAKNAKGLAPTESLEQQGMTRCPHTSYIHPNLSCVLDTTSLYQRATLASLPMIPSS